MRDSWVNNYEDVDFELPTIPKAASVPATLQETERMLSTPIPPRPASFHDTPLFPSDPISPQSPAVHTRSRSRTTPPLLSKSSTASLSEAASPFPSVDLDSRPNTRRSSTGFISSPLNPASSSLTSPPARPRPISHISAHVRRVASEESRVLSSASPPSMSSVGSRGSMILYRFSDAPDDPLVPPNLSHPDRSSIISTSGESFVSLSSDSKYPGILTERGFVPYAYDPAMDELDPADEEDFLHDPKQKFIPELRASWRGVANSGSLMALITFIVCLFLVYPVTRSFLDNARNIAIVMNTRINSSGQAVELSPPIDKRNQAPIILGMEIDPSTPLSEKTTTGPDNIVYELVFSDEFEVEGRTFYQGDDRFWEAEGEGSYDQGQITTHAGRLVIRQDTSPSDDGVRFVSGMLRNRNIFYLGTGYVEIGFMLPGQTSITRAFWSGAWTMRNPAMTESVQAAGRPLSLNLVISAPTPANHSRSSTMSSVLMLVEYVRIYQRKGDINVPYNTESHTSPGYVNTILDAYDVPW